MSVSTIEMTRDQVIRRISYLVREDIKEEFENKEQQAAIKDKSTFYVSNSNIEVVKVITYVKNDELIYDVLVMKEVSQNIIIIK